jgi:hypothetical protein
MIVLLNCLADNLEEYFTISKQLVTVGLLVPAHCQLSNTCICNKDMCFAPKQPRLHHSLSYTVYGSIFLNDLRFDAFSVYSCRYSLMRCIFKACSISHYFLHVYVRNCVLMTLKTSKELTVIIFIYKFSLASFKLYSNSENPC